MAVTPVEAGSRPVSQISGPILTSVSDSKSEMKGDFFSAVSTRPSQAEPFKSASEMRSGKPAEAPAPTTCCGKIKHRFIFASMCSIGLAITYGLKVNFHVCIVSMINHTAVAQMGRGAAHFAHNSSEGSCHPTIKGGNDTVPGHKVEGPFTWSTSVQGLLLGGYFYGYLTTQVVGGRMSEVFSAKWTFGIATLLNVVLTLLIPAAAYQGWGYLLAVRILEGAMAGVTMPATHVLLSKWAPKSEVSRISSLVYSGLSLGVVISVTASGLMASAYGWQSVFYSQAAVSVVFVIFWFSVASDSPAQDPWISTREKRLIMDSHGHHHHIKASPPVPWRSILRSGPFWSLVISHTGSNFGWYMLLTEIPTYMVAILGFDLKASAVLSAVPFLVMWAYAMFYGHLMDHLVHIQLISRGQMTKMSTAIAAYVPALAMVVLSLVGCSPYAAVALLTTATGAFGSMYSGFLSNHILIAPVFAGTLMAITNTIATISGVIVPNFVGAVINGKNTASQWRIVFITTAIVLVVHATQYCFFASGDEQEWSKTAHEDSSDDENAEVQAQ